MLTRSPIDTPTRERAYRLRALGSLAASLLTLTLLFRLWPLPDPTEVRSARTYQAPEQPIEIELIEPTIQTQTAPPAPPPPPQEILIPPVEVEDRRVVEDRIEELQIEMPVRDAVPNAPPAPPAPPGPPGPPLPATDPGPPPLVERPDRTPIPRFLPEPAYPPEARREGIRARISVRVLVDERGRPAEIRVVERVLIGRGDREEAVTSLPYGMEQAVINAAQRLRFQPAEHDGRRVRSYTTIPYTLGV